MLVIDGSEIRIGKTAVLSQDVGLYFDYKTRGKNTGHQILVEHRVEDRVVTSIEIPINYCPFCGRKLRDEEYKKYPWNE